MAPSCQRARGGFKRAWQLRAQGGRISAVGAKNETLGCKRCHDTYRVPKSGANAAEPSDTNVVAYGPEIMSAMREQAAKNAPSMAPEAALASMLDGLDCKSCHQVYRDETK
jgi:cytochrome c556